MEKNNLSRTVLIIDDDKFLISMMEMALKKVGYNVLTASEGETAIKIISEQSVDLIVVDLMMPTMDGLGLLQWLRNEVKLETPVLVQTGMAKATTKKEVLALGANAIIFKPVKLPEFIANVKNLEKLL